MLKSSNISIFILCLSEKLSSIIVNIFIYLLNSLCMANLWRLQVCPYYLDTQSLYGLHEGPYSRPNSINLIPNVITVPASCPLEEKKGKRGELRWKKDYRQEKRGGKKQCLYCKFYMDWHILDRGLDNKNGSML